MKLFYLLRRYWYIARMRVRSTWWQLQHAVEQRLPTCCARCGEWVQRRDSRPAQTTLGQSVDVCRLCHQELYGEE